MKVHIWCDERYPNYGMDANVDHHGRGVEVSEEFYAEYLAVEAAYVAMQDKLDVMAHQQTKPLPPVEPKLTEAEAEHIKATTPVESPEAVAAAIAAFEARKAKVA